jgi:DeoR family transcriptional regulator of aga operon
MPSDAAATARRAAAILESLLRSGRVAVDELAEALDVSPTTIRRDLRALERRGLLKRIHGGAAPVEPMLYEPFRHLSSFQEQERQMTDEKRRIALAAADYVNDGDVVAIGAGTTTTHVARSIRHRSKLTVVTNATNVAMELSHREDIKVFVTGGFLSGDWFALVGSAAVASLGEIFVDKAFVGVDGVDAERGLTTNYPEQAPVHRAMLQQARQRIVVADRRKIGKIATSLIAPIEALDLLVTDADADDAALVPFREKGINIRLA